MRKVQTELSDSKLSVDHLKTIRIIYFSSGVTYFFFANVLVWPLISALGDDKINTEICRIVDARNKQPRGEYHVALF